MDAFRKIERQEEIAQATEDINTRIANSFITNEENKTAASKKSLEEQSKINKQRRALDKEQKKDFKNDLSTIFDFEKNTNAGRVSNFKSTLGFIASAQSNGNKTLGTAIKVAAIAQATIDGITATQRALASGPFPANIGMAAIVAAIAANNVNAIRSSPAFAEGGIVPGTSFVGDQISANVNSGELILNIAQQDEIASRLGGSGDIIIQGNVMADDDEQVDGLIERLRDAVEFRNAQLIPA